MTTHFGLDLSTLFLREWFRYHSNLQPMVRKWHSLLGKWKWPWRICFERSWSDMERIQVFQYTMQLEFWPIRGGNFRCNTSCAQNGCKIANATWSEQIERPGLAWSHSVRYCFWNYLFKKLKKIEFEIFSGGKFIEWGRYFVWRMEWRVERRWWKSYRWMHPSNILVRFS